MAEVKGLAIDAAARELAPPRATRRKRRRPVGLKGFFDMIESPFIGTADDISLGERRA
jgi:hypothetical protein